MAAIDGSDARRSVADTSVVKVVAEEVVAATVPSQKRRSLQEVPSKQDPAATYSSFPPPRVFTVLSVCVFVV